MIPDYIKEQAKYELARRYFWNFCMLKAPDFYLEDRIYLKDICDKLQGFIESDKRVLVINMPPRHGKSRTATLLVEWLLGNDNKKKIMTGSYNEALSGSFAKQVRDSILEQGGIYSKIFPKTKIKYGEATQNKWALEGNEELSYLATSPTGTATGFGCNIMIIDDLIKNDEEAYNELTLDKHISWFNNTMLQRTETGFKIIIIMTRWAEKDLAGYVLSNYQNVEHINYKAVQDDGSMLCESILTKEDYDFKTKEMNKDIVMANYQQEPIDIKGKLYERLIEWNRLPEYNRVFSYTDTADTGSDYLVTIPYIVYNNEVYILDIQYDDRSMEITEKECAEMFYKWDVNEAKIESNNGGRGFARNVERILRDEIKSTKTIIKPFTQTGNKEARILASASWVSNHVFFPPNWKNKYPEAYSNLTTFQKKGKNKHDDIEDVLAGIYEQVTNKSKMEFGNMSLIRMGGISENNSIDYNE